MATLRFILLLLVAHTVGAQESSDTVGRGEQLYLQYACYSCHGYNGTGTPPLSREASGVRSNEQLFLTYLRLRADQKPVNPSRSMPHYSVETLSDQQALDIYAYLVSLNDETPELEEIPAFMEIIEAAESGENGESADE